jgi:NTP pyrophosphatase (non-canonical NTP hydrolase)
VTGPEEVTAAELAAAHQRAHAEVRARLDQDLARAAGDPETVALNWLARLTAEGTALPEWWHVLKLAEEAGEVCRAWLAVDGRARVRGSREELGEELADVVITAWVVALLRGIDLAAAIGDKHAELMTRDLGGLVDG